MALGAPWAGMLLHLDTSWLLMTVATVAVFGFFVAVIVANEHGISLRDLKLAIAWGLGGAFTFISVLALVKAGLARW